MTTITESGNSPASIAANIHYQLTHLQDSRGWEVITLNVVMVTLSTIAVVLRLVARRVVSVPLSWDDFLIIFALVRLTSDCPPDTVLKQKTGSILCPYRLGCSE